MRTVLPAKLTGLGVAVGAGLGVAVGAGGVTPGGNGVAVGTGVAVAAGGTGVAVGSLPHAANTMDKTIASPPSITKVLYRDLSNPTAISFFLRL